MRTLQIIVLAAASLVGCAHKDVKKDPVVTDKAGGAGASRADQTANNDAAGKSCSDDAECPERNLCINNHCVAIHPGLEECKMVRVHFDFNNAELKQSEFAVMQRMSRCLKADHHMKLEVRGNADERGSEEYNIALGDKRARVVAHYLENLGVSESQLNTVSFGEERPLCSEHNEDCWQQNRRAGLAPK
jgi:peptidoglycan-associated lipoprotein